MVYPHHVGIKAIEIYFPSLFVEQSDLEAHDGVSAGKYTIGLGQTRMSICDDREDTYSLALTAVSSLLQKYSISPKSIGRLEVGTESLIDRSKSAKTVLMQLFAASGNTDIEGVDTFNACYGGTSALFNAVSWIESRAWDGRDAIVVAGDIAVYSKGPARPTGGAGVVAILVGPEPPLVLDNKRGTYMQHAYDFYKPNLASEYPVVDGHFSNECYIRALDACYKAYSMKQFGIASNVELESKVNGVANVEVNGHSNGLPNGHNSDQTSDIRNENISGGKKSKEGALVSALESFDYMCFHSPNCKLVTKSFARLFYNDYVLRPTYPGYAGVPKELGTLPYESSLTHRALEKFFMELSKPTFIRSVSPGTLLPTMCGNMYTGSLYSSLASLLHRVPSEELLGKRIGMFSYGSGLASSMFSLSVVGDTSRIAAAMDIDARLKARTVVSPEKFEEIMELREKACLQNNYTPVGGLAAIRQGTYYLTHIDDKRRRFYNIAQ